MKYKIKNHIIDAKSPVEALKIHKLLDSKQNIDMYDAYNIKTGAIFKELKPLSDRYISYIKIMKADNDKISFVIIHKDTHSGQYYHVSNYDMSLKRFKEYLEGSYKQVNTLYDSIKDEAFDRQTIEALIADETAAIDAYNVAIANLKGKLSDEAIQVLQNIRNDEQNHVANLNAILSNNITEKNLEDSIHDRLSPSQYTVYETIKNAKETIKIIYTNGNYHLQKSDGSVSNWKTSDKSNAIFIAQRPNTYSTFDFN